jgi:hypothetical protein
MADQTSNHVVRLSADFKDFVRAGSKASKDWNRILSRATEAGVKAGSYTGLVTSNLRFEKKRAQLEKKFYSLSNALQLKNSGKLEARLTKVQQRIASLTQELSVKGLEKEQKLKLRASRVAFREQLRSLQKLNELSIGGASESLAAVGRELRAMTDDQERSARTLLRTTEQVERASEQRAKFEKMFRRDATRGADEFNESITNTLESMRSQMSRMDIGAMLSGGADGAARGLGGVAEIFKGAAAGGGALAGLAGTLGALTLAIGPLVAAFGVFAGMMFEIDGQVKEFNKTAINTFGTHSVVALGAGDMRKGLTTLRHVTQDLTKTLGFSEQEAVGFYDALDAGGYSLARLASGSADAEAALTGTLQRMGATAKSLGVEVSQFASTVTEYTDTLAFSLESVTDQFASLSKQASDAGFSTRRFYSFIVQASAGQASLNTHLSATADLLVRMAKTLGDKQAAEVLGRATGGFKEMGTQDRYRTLLKTGSSRHGIIARSAGREASTFVKDLTEEIKSSPEFTRALSQAGRGGAHISQAALADTTGETLVRELKEMSADDRDAISSAFSSSTDKNVQQLGRRLGQLTQVAKGTRGDLASEADALSGLDVQGTLEMQLSQLRGIIGTPLSEMTGVQRMLAEQETGMSGAQIEELQALERTAIGTWNILKATPWPVTEEEQQALIADQNARFGAHIDGQGRVILENGEEAESAMSLLTATSERGNEKAIDDREAGIMLAEEALDETISIGDLLQNDISMLLRDIYEEVGLPAIDLLSELTEGMLGWIGRLAPGHISSADRSARREARSGITKQAKTAREESRSASARIRELERTPGLSPEQTAELEAARARKQLNDAIVTESRSALDRLSSGDTSILTGTRTIQGHEARWSERDARGVSIPEQAVATRTETYTRTPEQVQAQILARARAGVGGAAATAPTTATATQAADARTEVAEQTSAPIVDATMEVAEATASEGSAMRAMMEAQAETSRDHLEKVLTKGQKLGNALAKSQLPDAIATAQLKLQIASMAYGSQNPAAIEGLTKLFEEGELTPDLRAALGTEGLGGALALAAGAHRTTTGDEADVTVTAAEDDFVYRGDGVRGTITPIDSADTLVGSKEGGALDRLAGGSTVNIAIYGGDERRVFDVVKRVLQQSGVGPGRVTARA